MNRNSLKNGFDQEQKLDETEFKKFRKLVHDVRNMKRLSKQNITDIEQLSHKNKMEIILTYDKMVEWFELFLDDKK